VINFNDIRLIAGLLFAFLLVNYSLNLIPWNYVLLIGVSVLAVGVYAKYDIGKGLKSGGDRDLKVEPSEAPKRINEKASGVPAYKKLDLEKVGLSSRKIHIDTQEVRLDGEKKNLMFGIVGSAENPYKDNQIVAYIYDLHEDRIRRYDSYKYTGQSRIQPFEGKHSWLQAEGISRKVVDEDQKSSPNVVVENNPKTEKESER
jgi:hypothetical protein